ncbi:NAD(P)/FAD-dependent oxidoreductase [Croceiramulus getboli]|nr:FAD-dependent oxidoreductase [Flavobacteriaceae bacterium YJPT1-3]
MERSYWETQSWFSGIDFTIVGSGLVGLFCALELKTLHPKANVLVIERGVLPSGASTKNAGFACYGSASELLDDLKHHSEEEVQQLVAQRYQGLKTLRETLGDQVIGYEQRGGFEVFEETQTELLEDCLQALPRLNALLKPVFGRSVFKKTSNQQGFARVSSQLLLHMEEGQLHTGKMMQALVQQCAQRGVRLLHGIELLSYDEDSSAVHLRTSEGDFKTNRLLIATNGFARTLGITEVQPARAQVLITKPLAQLPFRGTYHWDRGYYYFRDIDQRILLGGGRNLDFEGEETDQMEVTQRIQQRLESLLHEVILPGTPFEIEQRWSGIMGVGAQKKPIIKCLSSRVYCGVRLGGMGVALGSRVGQELASLATN